MKRSLEISLKSTRQPELNIQELKAQAEFSRCLNEVLEDGITGIANKNELITSFDFSIEWRFAEIHGETLVAL